MQKRELVQNVANQITFECHRTSRFKIVDRNLIPVQQLVIWHRKSIDFIFFFNLFYITTLFSRTYLIFFFVNFPVTWFYVNIMNIWKLVEWKEDAKIRFVFLLKLYDLSSYNYNISVFKKSGNDYKYGENYLLLSIFLSQIKIVFHKFIKIYYNIGHSYDKCTAILCFSAHNGL